MKMKVLILAIIAMCVILFVGCDFGQRINNAREAFMTDNPTAATIPVDEDGDGTTDFWGVDADGDHKVDTDSSGKLVEVPNTRQPLAEAGEVDTNIGQLIALAGAAFGLPTSILGAWWVRRKPIKRLTTLATAIEKSKQDGTPEGFITLSKASLELYLREMPGLVEVLNKMRAGEKAKRKAEWPNNVIDKAQGKL